MATAALDYGTVEQLEVVAQHEQMYNLTVDEAHTFFVGAGQWLVHNTCLTQGQNNVDFLRTGNNLGSTVEDPNATVRVGRWMYQSEYENMVTTGHVQVGSQGSGTSVTVGGSGSFTPPDARVYVEFDIPANSPWWITNDARGWITIPAPGSSQAAMWFKKTGQVISEMPPATFISLVIPSGGS